MNVAFLITSGYQLHHYGEIGRHLEAGTAIIETRDQDFGMSAELVSRHLPGWDVEWVPQSGLDSLDGRFDAIVCQTPILPMRFFRRTHVVAQQYSLGKEIYQYGVWRSHAALNLMYGPYSCDFVGGFSRAKSVGNPLFDVVGSDPPESSGTRRTDRPIVYLPTYGDLSSFERTAGALSVADVEVVFKPHHADLGAFAADLPDNFTIVDTTTHPVELIRGAQAVITDFSGAAYDAAFCRVPVVLAGTELPVSEDVKRLSKSDLQHDHLDGLAARWDPERETISEIVDRAHAMTCDEDRYGTFVNRFFVNPGGAGAACAAEIRALIEHGPVQHVVADMVSGSLRQHITQNRTLRSSAAASRPHDDRSTVDDLSSLVRREAGKVIRRHPALGSTVERLRRLRSRRRSSAAPDEVVDDTTARWSAFTGRPGPSALRMHATAELVRHLDQQDVEHRTDVRWPGTIAVETRHRGALYRALVATSTPSILDRAVFRTSTAVSVRLDALSYEQIDSVTQIQVGSRYERLDHVVDVDGFARIVFVEWNASKARMLTLDGSAAIVDWTKVFRDDDASASAADDAAPTTTQGPFAFRSPVDVVYTWVDSSDPRWRASFSEHVGQADRLLASAANDDRFESRNELMYSLRSLDLFAPFVRHVFIVTDDQVPPWLDVTNPRLTVVDHRELFPDTSVLPVFNSHAIEASLHRIPDLAEHFVYMNDDTMFGAEVTPDDFFTTAGLPKIRLSPSQYVYDDRPESTAIPTDFASYNVRDLVERDFDVAVTRRVKHVPHPQRRSGLEALESRYSEAFTRTRRARFRAMTDVAIPSMLAPWFGIASGAAVEWPNVAREYYYADTGRADWSSRVEEIRRHRPKFICLNATLHDDIDAMTQDRNLFEFLSRFLPVPSSFEAA